MRKMILTAALLAGATVFAADKAAAPAAEKTPAAEKSAKPAKAAAPTDPQIAHIAVTANQIDIDAAKAAMDKTQNEKVKAFAQKMIDDHTAVIKQATELVTKLNVTPEDNDTSKALQAQADKTKEEIGTKSGADFDKAYAANEVAYHKAVIAAVEKTLIPNAKNKELKAFLVKVKPALQEHLHHAQMLVKELAAAK